MNITETEFKVIKSRILYVHDMARAIGEINSDMKESIFGVLDTPNDVRKRIMKTMGMITKTAREKIITADQVVSMESNLQSMNTIMVDDLLESASNVDGIWKDIQDVFVTMPVIIGDWNDPTNPRTAPGLFSFNTEKKNAHKEVLGLYCDRVNAMTKEYKEKKKTLSDSKEIDALKAEYELAKIDLEIAFFQIERSIDAKYQFGTPLLLKPVEVGNFNETTKSSDEESLRAELALANTERRELADTLKKVDEQIGRLETSVLDMTKKYDSSISAQFDQQERLNAQAAEIERLTGENEALRSNIDKITKKKGAK